jgi:hypothetical protein
MVKRSVVPLSRLKPRILCSTVPGTGAPCLRRLAGALHGLNKMGRSPFRCCLSSAEKPNNDKNPSPRPSAALLMTKRGGCFPVGIGLRDPRSQTRDPGHPSISPSDIAEGTSFNLSLPTRLSESATRDEKAVDFLPFRCPPSRWMPRGLHGIRRNPAISYILMELDEDRSTLVCQEDSKCRK